MRPGHADFSYRFLLYLGLCSVGCPAGAHANFVERFCPVCRCETSGVRHLQCRTSEMMVAMRGSRIAKHGPLARVPCADSRHDGGVHADPHLDGNLQRTPAAWHLPAICGAHRLDGGCSNLRGQLGCGLSPDVAPKRAHSRLGPCWRRSITTCPAVARAFAMQA